MPDEIDMLELQLKNELGEEKYNLIYKSRFKKLHKEHKALEILKKKGVNVALVLRCNTAKEYNKHFDIDFEKLTDDEFELLKEVFV